MAAVLDLVTDALREIGVLAAGEVATADEATGGLNAFNRLLDQWAAEKLAIYEQARTTFTISASTQAYAVGSGQTVSVARPIYIDHLTYTDSSVTPLTEVPLNRLTVEGWASVSQKSATATAPTDWYYAPDYPYGSIKLWPIPTSSTLTGVLYHPKQVAEYAALATTVALPPGYRRMIVKNLAVEMAPSYDRQVPAALAMQADDSVRVVKRSNWRPRDLAFEFTADASPTFDIEEG